MSADVTACRAAAAVNAGSQAPRATGARRRGHQRTPLVHARRSGRRRTLRADHGRRKPRRIGGATGEGPATGVPTSRYGPSAQCTQGGPPVHTTTPSGDPETHTTPAAPAEVTTPMQDIDGSRTPKSSGSCLSDTSPDRPSSSQGTLPASGLDASVHAPTDQKVGDSSSSGRTG